MEPLVIIEKLACFKDIGRKGRECAHEADKDDGPCLPAHLDKMVGKPDELADEETAEYIDDKRPPRETAPHDPLNARTQGIARYGSKRP